MFNWLKNFKNICVFSVLIISFPLSALAKEFIVNNTTDQADANFGGVFDGVCETVIGNGACTLRAAIQEANDTSEKDTITLPEGEIILIGNSGDDNNLGGDLDIVEDLLLRGVSGRKTIIKSSGSDRVIHMGNSSSVEIYDLSIRDGRLQDDNGAGIFNAGGSLTIKNCMILNNINQSISFSNGGGIFHQAGDLTIENTTISQNQATDQDGGGIYISSGTVELKNSTISRNFAGSSGGGILSNGPLNISNSTVTLNESFGIGGIGCGGNCSLHNSIIAGNLELNGGTHDCNGIVILGGNNIIGDDTDCNIQGGDNTEKIGTSDSPIAPLLGPLQNNGGPTDTHALLEGSPAINNGDNANCPDTDQRGVVRDDGNCDIGAYEATCGDNIKQIVEECDDGNGADGDGCSSSCLLENAIGGTGTGSGSSGGCAFAKGNPQNSPVWFLTLLAFMGIGLVFRGLKKVKRFQ